MANLVGVLRQNGKDGILELDRKDENLGNKLIIPRKFLNGAPFNMKVVAEVKGVDSKNEAYGAVIEVLGEENNPDTAILAIMKYYDLPMSGEFPAQVLEEAESFEKTISEEEIFAELELGRRDLRDFKTITIDGEDAKDLDDAIDIERLTNGNFKLWVHIADVTYYVTEGSALDKEALKRGNSVYLVDRVIPMYPPQLSNGICSLNPDQDRFAFTAEMEIDQKGKILGGELYTSIIRSKVRSSYLETQALLDGEAAEEDRPDWFVDKIFLMKELTDILQAERTKRGALQFEFPETKVDLDETGHPIKIYPEPDLYTNHLIESFMIAANEFTAQIAKKNKIPVLYRVHELPDLEKLLKFKKLAKIFNIKVRISPEPEPMELAWVLEQIKDEPYGQTLSALLLRSLAKARYTEKNLGHFGLASKNYCHFTAPIRRYSDTITHRNLKQWIFEKNKFSKKEFAQVSVIGDHVSETERTAISAERDTIDQKAAEFYADKIGEIYPGKISGFAPSSLFVQLENTVEGAIFFRTLDGYYEYDPEQLMAFNKRTGDVLAIGQDVRIQIAAVDVNRRFIDFALVDHATAEVASNKKNRNKKHSNNSKTAYNKPKTKPRQKNFSGKSQPVKKANSGKKISRRKKAKNKGTRR